MGFLRFGVHFTGCGVAASNRLLSTYRVLIVYLSLTCQRAAEDGFAADFGSVSGDGHSFDIALSGNYCAIAIACL